MKWFAFGLLMGAGIMFAYNAYDNISRVKKLPLHKKILLKYISNQKQKKGVKLWKKLKHKN